MPTHTTSLWTSARHAILVSLHAHTTMRNTALVECSLSLLSSARGALQVRQRAPCLLAAGRSRPRCPVSSLLLVCVAPMCSRTPPGSVSQPSTSGMPEYVLVHIRVCTNQYAGAGSVVRRSVVYVCTRGRSQSLYTRARMHTLTTVSFSRPLALARARALSLLALARALSQVSLEEPLRMREEMEQVCFLYVILCAHIWI